MIRYRGLTWDHPRGFNALSAAARRLDAARDGLAIDWDRHPLEGFESHPVHDLCGRYDLVVLDHPHIGEAVARGCLRPLEEVFAPADLVAWSEETIGPCFPSYRYRGQQWAVPLDAATQVMASREELVDRPPGLWDEVVALSARVPVALSVAGPHAILTFFSIAAALGHPAAEGDPETLVPSEPGAAALDIMATLYGRMPPVAAALNPVGLLQAMSDGTAPIALCALVYGYVTYATPGPGRPSRLTFSDAPRATKSGRPGSTLGGTGIGISRRCEVTPALVEHLRWLMTREAQVGFIPAHDGQPSRREAWHDATLNERYGNFYRNTAASVETAYVRPRHDGYVAFQAEVSGLIRRALAERTRHAIVLERLDAAYRNSVTSGRQGH